MGIATVGVWKPCLFCQQPFKAFRKDKVWCSASCRSKAWMEGKPPRQRAKCCGRGEWKFCPVCGKGV